DPAVRHVDDEHAVRRAVLARRRVRQPLAVLREDVSDDALEPTLLARGEVAQHERRAVLLAVLRPGAPAALRLARGRRLTGAGRGLRSAARGSLLACLPARLLTR